MRYTHFQNIIIEIWLYLSPMDVNHFIITNYEHDQCRQLLWSHMDAVWHCDWLFVDLGMQTIVKYVLKIIKVGLKVKI